MPGIYAEGDALNLSKPMPNLPTSAHPARSNASLPMQSHAAGLPRLQTACRTS